MTKVFIDGKSGTTGLRIYERLGKRSDIEIITLPEEKRHDSACRRDAIFAADAAFLCLPDDAARESAALAEGSGTVILDTSTAHRTSPGWCYGFPELSEERALALKTAKRIAVPGCHASGFIALVAPLVAAGVIRKDITLSAFSLTGYSGGGKKMIAQYESDGRDALLSYPRQYGLSQTHKHLPEMKAVCGLDKPPVFLPVVGDFYSGMEVSVPLPADEIEGGLDAVREVYRSLYRGPVVTFRESADEEGFLSAGKLAGTDAMEITAYGNGERVVLTARYDNLGKGASGAAIQCMNMALGFDPAEGLEL